MPRGVDEADARKLQYALDACEYEGADPFTCDQQLDAALVEVGRRGWRLGHRVCSCGLPVSAAGHTVAVHQNAE